MAGRGRGRGRGILSTNITPVSPGGGDYQALMVKLGHIRSAEEEKNKENAVKQDNTSREATGSLSDIEELLGNLQLDVEETDLKTIKQLCVDVARTGEDLKTIAGLIYQKCVEDREFAKAGAMICHELSTIEVEGTKFRNCILSLLQSDFKEKEALRKKSCSRYMSFVTALCQIFGHMRTATGELFKPLVGPICESIELILEEEESETMADEFEFLGILLQSVGKSLETVGSERLNKLMEKVRARIINNGTSPRLRCTLMEILETYLRRFDELPNDVTRFYCDTMADILSGLVV